MTSSSLRRITTAQRRARLSHRHHLCADAKAAGVGVVARSLIGLHATDPASVYLSTWARVDGVTYSDIDAALYDERTVVKHLAMRRTLWAVATDLLPVVQSAASDAVAAVQRRSLARDVVRAGLTNDGERWVAQAEAATVDALAELGPAPGRTLTAHVPLLQAKIRTGPSGKLEYGVISRITTVLSASGQITRGRARGAWHDRQLQWVLMRDWCPEGLAHSRLPAEEARAVLARLWLRAFGPTTGDDLRWWTGWTVKETKAALLTVGAVEVRLDGDQVGVLLPDDLETTPRAEPWVALLPSLDPTTMGWKDRGWYLGPHRELLFDTYGNAGPSVWSDGRVVGGWGQRPDGRVVVRLLEDVGAAKATEIQTEAARLTEWLGGVVVRPSFPTPLQRELSG